MKIIAINNTNTTAFKGLWAKANERVASVDEYCITQEILNIYHPFKDEKDSDIIDALSRKNFKTSCPTENENIYKNIISEGRESQRLSFTEADFSAYKKFYGKELPEKFKNIEMELKKFDLGHYINGGLFFKIKKFIHNIKFV